MSCGRGLIGGPHFLVFDFLVFDIPDWLRAFLSRSLGNRWYWCCLTVKFFELEGRVLLKEILNVEEATSNLDLELLTFDLDHYFSGTERVLPKGVTQEHNFEFLAIRVTVDELSESQVHWIRFYWDIEHGSRLEVHDVPFESLDFALKLLKRL